MRNVSWLYVPDRHRAEYLAGRVNFGGVRCVTGRNRGKTYKPKGKRECARRLRQMEGRANG